MPESLKHGKRVQCTTSTSRSHALKRTFVQYVKPNSGYHSLEDKSIMPNVPQKATYTQTKLQLHLSKCNISFQWTLFTNGPIHNAQHPVKCHT